MEIVKTFWTNLTKAQKVGLIVVSQILSIILIATILNAAIQPKKHVNEVLTEEDNIGLSIPGKDVEMFKNALWGVVSKNVDQINQNILNDVTIREGTYEETELESSKIASFIIDIDSIKQTYKVSISWVTDPKSGLYDDVMIDCPPQSQMKYPETICYGMYNSTYSLDLYLPYQIDSPYKDKYKNASPDVYIEGDESTGIITVKLNPCNNIEDNKKKANEYIKSIPTIKDYKTNYVVRSKIDVICEEDL